MNKTTLKFLVIILFFLGFVGVILTPLAKKKTPLKPVAHKTAVVKKPLLIKGRIAIVIDDWGYNLSNLQIIRQIKQPLTCAVLPALKHSAALSQQLNNLGCEIILHLPMEPKEQYDLEKNTVTTVMPAKKIREIIEQDLSSVGLAKGISNHMGSKVSQDPKTAAVILAQAKLRGLYFFDSFVIKDSVFPDLAREMKVRFAQRDIFLDNQGNFEYIRSQLEKLKNLAARNGLAIGIGHDRKNTLLVLKEVLPEIEKEGYEFIFLSQAVR
jgi:polysaccharide deacetylase 2 family uncharacterized protein YibQ